MTFPIRNGISGIEAQIRCGKCTARFIRPRQLLLTGRVEDRNRRRNVARPAESHVLEFFKTANRVRFGVAGMFLGNSTFRVMSSQANQLCQIQLALKLSFEYCGDRTATGVKDDPMTSSRRSFLHVVAGGSLYMGARAAGETAKQLRGIFPIAQTPFTVSDKLDVDSLVKQLRFIDRGRVHGFVWPQLASEWSTLSESERMEGAEALGSAAKKLRPALVLGVQAPDTDAAVRYAIQAKKVGADAIISLPPVDEKDPKAVVAYYKRVGEATDLPLFAQAVGNMSVPTLIEMYKSIPTFRYVKDEAGQPLFRIKQLREQSSDQLKVFTGGHGRTMIDEMNRGFSGTMPAASFADLYASAWDLWQEGKQKESMDMFGRVSMLISEISVYGIESLKYILQLRGVFQTFQTREKRDNVQSAASIGLGGHLDESGKEIIRRMLDDLKPWLKA